jgi:tetratricopeptide (TPR) repeat protein
MLDAMRVVLLLLIFSAWTVWAQQPEPDGLLKRAIEAQQRGDNETAIQDYEKLLKFHPNLVEARANLGAALAHEGRCDEAIAQYKLALSATSNDAIRMNMAIAYYKKGDLESARRLARRSRATRNSRFCWETAMSGWVMRAMPWRYSAHSNQRIRRIPTSSTFTAQRWSRRAIGARTPTTCRRPTQIL